jgi:hypothetical protein
MPQRLDAVRFIAADRVTKPMIESGGTGLQQSGSVAGGEDFVVTELACVLALEGVSAETWIALREISTTRMPLTL